MKSVATWSLAAAIFTCTLWGFFDWPHPLLRFGLVPQTWLNKYGVTILSCLFFHTSWLHLMGNVFFLLLFGGATEKSRGAGYMLGLFFTAAIAAGALHVLVASKVTFIAVGASGAIAGLVSYLSIKAPRQKLYLLPVPTWVGLIVALSLQLYAGWLQYHQVTQLSVFAHVGGALTGIVFTRLS